ncbi:MAG: RNA-binding protein [Gammaproteobacteria bacterium]|nr:MAG: RNA-binding protein [Gammaproteobacteria bacterium]
MKNYHSEAFSPEAVRLDKWLWAARFFKTRALARQAIEGGKVTLNDVRAKPAKTVRPGDRLVISRGSEKIEVVVKALAEQRGPAKVAVTLYEETEASQQRRARLAEERKMAAIAIQHDHRKPDKHARRKMQKFKRGDFE